MGSSFLEPAIAQVMVAKEAGKFAITIAKTVSAQLGRKSLTRMTQDYIFQYPMIISSDIDIDEVQVIAKGFELNYASLLITFFSVEGEMNRAKYGTVSDYLKTLHTNRTTPEMISNNLILESALPVSKMLDHIIVTESEMMSLWQITEEQADMDSLNDIYQPYTRTKSVLESCLAKMQGTMALEEFDNHGSDDNKKTIGQIAADLKYEDRTKKPGETSTLDDAKAEFYSKHPNAANAKAFAEDIKRATGRTPNTKVIANTKNISGKDSNMIVESRQLSTMAPTMINVTLTQYDTTDGSSVQWRQNILLGVKAMIRWIRPQFMIANMVEAAKDAPIFRMIQWTKGEYKLADLIFGTKEYKDMALPNVNNRWLKSLKKQAKSNKARRFVPGMKQLLPNTTIVMTETEAIMVKDACGIDLHDVVQAKRIIKNYNLLALAIYNPETKILNALFDQDYDNYSTISLRQMTALVRKDTNLLGDR